MCITYTINRSHYTAKISSTESLIALITITVQLPAMVMI